MWERSWGGGRCGGGWWVVDVRGKACCLWGRGGIWEDLFLGRGGEGKGGIQLRS